MEKNNMYLKCKVCGEQFTSFAYLKTHLKEYHKLAAKGYFESTYKRIDRFDGKKIEYKSFDQYITCDFIDKRNYKNWLKEQTPEQCADYFKHKLAQYADLKGLTCAPSQVECQTINCLLPISTMEAFSGTHYKNLYQNYGLYSRFNYEIPDNIPWTPIPQIMVDSREQKPFHFEEHITIDSKLEYGDYSLHPNNKLAIERKSLSDLFGTLSGGLERFEREIKRAKKLEGYIVVLVESTLNNMMYQKQRFGKASGDFIAHNMRQLLRKNDNVQFVFCDGREDAKNKCLHILGMNEQVFNIDLQYYFTTKWL